jgi:hypothetical protein
MDMRKRDKLGSWLTGAVIHALFRDAYHGIVAAVTEELVRDDHTHKTTLEGVVTFADGWKLVLNKSRRLDLIARFGDESDAWIGQPLDVATHGVERTNPNTGAIRVVWMRSFPLGPRTDATAGKPITRKQQMLVVQIAEVHGVTKELLGAFLTARGIPSVEAIRRDQYDAIVQALAEGAAGRAQHALR